MLAPNTASITNFGIHGQSALPPIEMRGDGLGGGYSSGEESRALQSIEQNIANLERSIRRNGAGGSSNKLNSMERNTQVRFAGGKQRTGGGRDGDYIDSDDVNAGQLTRSASLDITTGNGAAKRRQKTFNLPTSVKKRYVIAVCKV